MSLFRRGQWVSTKTEIPGAHLTPDGRAIGIYLPRHTPLAPVGTKPVEVPEHVAFVREDGLNLTRLSDDGSHAVKVVVAPEDLEDLRAVTEADHLPLARIQHLAEGHKLDP